MHSTATGLWTTSSVQKCCWSTCTCVELRRPAPNWWLSHQTVLPLTHPHTSKGSRTAVLIEGVGPAKSHRAKAAAASKLRSQNPTSSWELRSAPMRPICFSALSSYLTRALGPGKQRGRHKDVRCAYQAALCELSSVLRHRLRPCHISSFSLQQTHLLVRGPPTRN